MFLFHVGSILERSSDGCASTAREPLEKLTWSMSYSDGS